MNKNLTYLLLLTAGAAWCTGRPPVAQGRAMGIDVSNFQGSINWTQVAADSVGGSSISFAWAKCDEGSASNVDYIDPTFQTNVAGATTAGIMIGAYHLAHPELDTPASEADFFVANARAQIGAGYLRPVLDLEEGGGVPVVGASSLSGWVNDFLSDVQALSGVTPIIYTDSNYAQSYLDSSVAKNNLWIANYNYPTQSQTASPPVGVFNVWNFWQYTDSLSLSGISGNVDGDVANGPVSYVQSFVTPIDTLQWNSGESGSGGTDGNGTWGGTGKQWYDTTTVAGPVLWTTGDGAALGSGSSGQYTITLTNDVICGQNETGTSNAGPFVGLTVASGANYNLNGSGQLYSLTDNGRFQVNGRLTLGNITLDNSSYDHNVYSSISGVYGGQLNIGAGANVNAAEIDAGGGSGATGTINVNSGGSLLVGSRLQINFGKGPASGTGGVVNVEGGTISLGSSGIIWLSDVNTGGGSNGSVGTLNVGTGGTGGIVTAPEMETAYNNTAQTGVLNIYSGAVTLTGGIAVTANGSAVTDVNVYGGTFNAASGTITSAVGAGTNLNVTGGIVTAATIDAAGTTSMTISGSGIVKATSTGVGGSITSGSGGTTTINLDGGVLFVYTISGAGDGNTTLNFNGGMLQENGGSSFDQSMISSAGGSKPNVYIDSGGGIIDNNSATVIDYAPFLAGTTSGGGLTIANSGSGGAVELAGGANTYTGATEIKSGATLALAYHNGVSATIVDSRLLQIDTGGTLDLTEEATGQQISVGGLRLAGGTLRFLLDGSQLQSIAASSAATVSGTNWIDIFTKGSSLTVGTYNLISDGQGGLSGGGSLNFGNGLDQETVVVGSNGYLLTLINSATLETLTVGTQGTIPEPPALGLVAEAVLLLGWSRRTYRGFKRQCV